MQPTSGAPGGIPNDSRRSTSWAAGASSGMPLGTVRTRAAGAIPRSAASAASDGDTATSTSVSGASLRSTATVPRSDRMPFGV